MLEIVGLSGMCDPPREEHRPDELADPERQDARWRRSRPTSPRWPASAAPSPTGRSSTRHRSARNDVAADAQRDDREAPADVRALQDRADRRPIGVARRVPQADAGDGEGDEQRERVAADDPRRPRSGRLRHYRAPRPDESAAPRQRATSSGSATGTRPPNVCSGWMTFAFAMSCSSDSTSFGFGTQQSTGHTRRRTAPGRRSRRTPCTSRARCSRRPARARGAIPVVLVVRAALVDGGVRALGLTRAAVDALLRDHRGHGVGPYLAIDLCDNQKPAPIGQARRRRPSGRRDRRATGRRAARRREQRGTRSRPAPCGSADDDRLPASPAARTAGTSGIRASSGTSNAAGEARAAALAEDRILRARTTGRRSRPCSRRSRAPASRTCANIAMPRPTSSSATSCGVVTITPPVTGTCCTSVSGASPVPGGRSTTRTSVSPQSTSFRNCRTIPITIGPRQMTGDCSSRKKPIDMQLHAVAARSARCACRPTPRARGRPEHDRHARTVDVGVDEADALPERRRSPAPGSPRRVDLPTPPFVLDDRDHVPHARDRRAARERIAPAALVARRRSCTTTRSTPGSRRSAGLDARRAARSASPPCPCPAADPRSTVPPSTRSVGHHARASRCRGGSPETGPPSARPRDARGSRRPSVSSSERAPHKGKAPNESLTLCGAFSLSRAGLVTPFAHAPSGHALQLPARRARRPRARRDAARRGARLARAAPHRDRRASRRRGRQAHPAHGRAARRARRGRRPARAPRRRHRGGGRARADPLGDAAPRRHHRRRRDAPRQAVGARRLRPRRHARRGRLPLLSRASRSARASRRR